MIKLRPPLTLGGRKAVLCTPIVPDRCGQLPGPEIVKFPFEPVQTTIDDFVEITDEDFDIPF